MAPLDSRITPLGRELLDQLPVVLREDPDYISVIHCYAREFERLNLTVEQVRAELSPATASVAGLHLWELLLKLPMVETDTTVRRERAVERYRSLVADPARGNWVNRVQGRVGSAWSWQLDPGQRQRIQVFLPYLPGSQAWDGAVRAVEEETPSEIQVQFFSIAGFLLDISQMDDPPGIPLLQ